jgi:signal transduction histidine kinase
MMAPILQISSVLIDGDTVDHTEGLISLKPGQYELVVNFVGISFTNPEMVFYQTQLEGYDQAWAPPTFSRKVVFIRVGHGNYAFKIRAYNVNDIKSEMSTAFSLRIKKPVYLTIWFYGILMLLVGTAFYMILRIRERNHRLVQEGLLKNLDEKTKEIIVKEEIIKERKKVEKILIEAKTKAELSEKLKTAFLQNMSHEIRTPMNAIVGFTQLLNEEGLSNEVKKEFINNVLTNAESLLKLINDILDLSKLETNQLVIEKEKLRVNTLIRDVELIFRKRLSVENKANIEFATRCPGNDELEIVADKTRIIQILNNLLDNALKFTESGSIILGYTLDELNTTFFVEDTGIGLAEDKKDIVFDLFRKVEDDRFKLYGGTGLGLTLAKYLVKLMGGEIDVESKQDVGSKFYFYLPLSSRKEYPDD